MKLFFKKISYKILVVLMIIVNLSFFSVSSISQAKLKLKDGENYYSGTQEAQLSVPASFFDKIKFSLADIIDYLVGLSTLSFRGIIVGWIELMEIILTAILGLSSNFSDYIANAISGIDTYSQDIVNVESIIFNRVEILNANIFDNGSAISLEEDEQAEAIQKKEKLTDQQSIANIIGDSVVRWYYILRLIVIAFMLLVLLFVGIKMAISSISEEKALYKKMLVDWVVGMIIIFTIHYMMIAILSINDDIVDSLKKFMIENPSQTLQEYEYGEETKAKTPDKIETTLYETVRTRAYSLKMTEGVSGLILYAILVYYAWKFALIYFRRMLNIVMLTLLAPIVSASYAMNKILTGKSKIFSTWLSEYIMNVIIQIVHIVIYVTFVSIALELSLVSLGGVVLSVVLLSFMSKSGKLLRQLFRLSGGEGSLAGDMMERTSFKQLRKEVKGLNKSMIGGALTANAVKMTYGALTRPAGELATMGVAKVTAAIQNSEKYQNKQAQKTEEEVKKIEDYLKNDKQAIELNEDIQKLENEMDKYQGQDEAQQKERKRIQAEIKAKQAEIEKIGTAYIESQDVNLFSLFKDNLWGAMKKLNTDGKTVYDENGNIVYLADGKTEMKQYKAKDNDIIREDGSMDKRENWRRNHIWSKKRDSLGLQFKNNLKLGKLFDLNDAQSKQVKQQYKFWSNKVLTALSIPAGLAIDPRITLGAMGKATIDGLDLATRRRLYKGAVATGQGNYKFKGYGDKTINDLSFAESFALLEIEKLNEIGLKRQKKELKHFNKALKGIKKRDERKEKIIEEKNETNIKEIKQHTDKYKKNINEQVESMSTEELIKNEIIRDKNTVSLENGDLMKLTANAGLETFRNNLKDIYSKNPNKYKRALKNKQKELVKQKIRENQGILIADAVVKYCQENNIEDINDLKLNKAIDKEKLAKGIVNMIEDQDVLKSNKIDLNGYNIDNKTISAVIAEMKDNSAEINQWIKDNAESNQLSTSVKKFIGDLKSIESIDKIDLVIDEINKNQEMLIQEAVLAECEQNEIYDIENLQEVDIGQINQKILDIVQEEGVIGNIDVKFNENAILQVIQNMSSERQKEQTNEQLKNRLVTSSILEYIAENKIENRTDLRKQEAREKIYQSVKDKLTPESSKQSAKVISRIKGEKEEIKLPPDTEQILKANIKNNTAKITRITKAEIKNEAGKIDEEQKENLRDREKRRRMVEASKELKQAVDLYGKIDKSDEYNLREKQQLREQINENISNEDILEILFLTQKLEKNGNLSKEYIYSLINDMGK